MGCPWKKARKTRRLRVLARLIKTLPKDEVIVYVDEVDIHLNPKIGPDWMLRGTQKTVLTPGKNEKRYLARALNARTGRLTWVEAERKTSLLFIWQLWYLLKRDYPEAKRIHLVLDNYRIHSSRQVELVLAKLGDKVQLHFCTSCRPTARTITASNACGATCTQTLSGRRAFLQVSWRTARRAARPSAPSGLGRRRSWSRPRR